MFNKLTSYAISSNVPIYLCENVMCRLCGCMGSNMSFILLKESCYLIKMIQEETKIKIQGKDNLPKTVCRGCVDKIHLIKHFKTHCRKTQKVLENMFKEKSTKDCLSTKNECSQNIFGNNETGENSDMVVEWLEDEFSKETDTNISNVTTNTEKDLFVSKNVLINKTNSNYGIIYNDTSTFTSVRVTLQDKNLPSNAIGQLKKKRVRTTNDLSNALGHIKKQRVQTYSTEKVYSFVKNENVHEIEETEETETYSTDVHSSLFKAENVNETETEANGPLLYKLLTSEKKSEPDEENYDKNTDKINENNNLDELSDEDETPDERTDRSGRVFLSSSRKYVKKESEKEYSCKICNCKFRYPCQVEHHVRKHTGELPFKCKHCEKSFITGFYLLKHERTHSNGQFTCEVCGKNFRRYYNLKDHQRIHSDATPNFKCDNCSKEFFTKGNYDTHKLIHAEKKHICEICGKRFSIHALMKRHQNSHKNITYQCQLCPKVSKTKEEHHQHRKRHEKNGLYYCTDCSLSFWTKKGLQMHDRVYHKNDLNSETNIVENNENSEMILTE